MTLVLCGTAAGLEVHKRMVRGAGKEVAEGSRSEQKWVREDISQIIRLLREEKAEKRGAPETR